jgi:hypothetical protein
MNNEQFGWYITGFADGESCFMLRPFFRVTKGGHARIVFSHRWSIQIREDDLDILERIKNYLDKKEDGTGNISFRKRKNDSSANVTLQYDGFKNCGVIVSHFKEFPLQAKKKDDFKFWEKGYNELGKFPSGRILKRQYNLDETEERLQICKIADELRVGRLHNAMKDLGTEELLRRAGGSNDLYVKQALNFLYNENVITKEQYPSLFKKYEVKI